MDFKKSAINLKTRAKELGYEIKLTHAQELVATTQGHKSRHSAIKSNIPVNNEEIKPNTLCQCCERNPRTTARLTKGENATIWLLCEDCCGSSSKFSTLNDAVDVTDNYNLQSTYLRDFLKQKLAFTFEAFTKDDKSIGLFFYVPLNGVFHNYGVKVWSLNQKQEVMAWHDWVIKVIDS